MIESLMLSFAAAFGWGLSPLFGRIALKNLDGLTFVVLRAMIVGVLCLIYTLLYKKQAVIKFLDENVITNYKPLIFLVIASLSVFFGSVCYFSALKNSLQNMILVSLVSYLLPVIVISLASTLVYGDKINKEMIFGMLVTIIGISIVVYFNPNKST